MGKLLVNSELHNNDWKKPTGNEITSQKLSVVIPVYHPRYLKEVLDHLSKLDGIYEVITVFDGMDDDPYKVIDDYNYKFTVVKHNRNCNAPGANNTGSFYATGDLLLFLDQDMILSPFYIENAKRLLVANDNKGVVLGFRDNVDYEEVPSLDNWKEANYLNDWRMRTTVNESFLDLTVNNCGSVNNHCNKDKILEIYKDSDEFRKLGTDKDRTIGFWDLPCMVISHSLTIPRKDFKEIGGYPEWIIGWGGEDIALGFLAVSNHLKIIPNVVGSYHIKHEPHSGSEEQKWKEMRRNLEKYKEWSSSISEFPKINEEDIYNRSKVLYKSR
jgi:glycosyltransferase involved in cell wall biosynthesis